MPSPVWSLPDVQKEEMDLDEYKLHGEKVEGVFNIRIARHVESMVYEALMNRDSVKTFGYELSFEDNGICEDTDKTDNVKYKVRRMTITLRSKRKDA
jgi:hypothetical protein